MRAGACAVCAHAYMSPFRARGDAWGRATCGAV